jgi:hypothetical protein
VQHLDRFFNAGELRPRQHAFDAALQLLRAAHPAAGIQPLQQRRQVGGEIDAVNRLAAA